MDRPTFDELFASHRLKPPEREQLVWHLAYMRMRKTIEVLSKKPADVSSSPPPAKEPT